MVECGTKSESSSCAMDLNSGKMIIAWVCGQFLKEYCPLSVNDNNHSSHTNYSSLPPPDIFGIFQPWRLELGVWHLIAKIYSHKKYYSPIGPAVPEIWPIMWEKYQKRWEWKSPENGKKFEGNLDNLKTTNSNDLKFQIALHFGNLVPHTKFQLDCSQSI